jgi:hypothetical protein
MRKRVEKKAREGTSSIKEKGTAPCIDMRSGGRGVAGKRRTHKIEPSTFLLSLSMHKESRKILIMP